MSVKRRILFALLARCDAGELVQVVRQAVALSSNRPPAERLRFLFALADILKPAIERSASAYNGGIHPKHRLTGYHDFFIRHVGSGESVLDVGCGDGSVDYDIVKAVPDVRVTGIDMSQENVEKARSLHPHERITFVRGRVPEDLPREHFDAVILSNVLEHLEEREAFLGRIILVCSPSRILIRAPLFERHWSVPMRRELGLSYFSDATHKTEYTQESFEEELARAGLRIVEKEVRWGEVWAVTEAG